MADFSTTLDARIAEVAARFDLLESGYARARARLDGLDEEWEEEKKRIIEKIARTVARFKLEDPATKAVAIVAMIQQDCFALTAPQKMVDDYEEVKQELMFLKRQRREQETAYANAKKLHQEERQRWGRNAM
jgi:hypothetical protein